MRKFAFTLLLMSWMLSFSFAQQTGIASYYSDSFQGRKTASGEKYDKTKYTGAHKTLPFGTIVKVTRLDNGKSVKVRINDTGPYISGRIIELSGVAGEAIGLYDDGTADVKLEVLAKSDSNPKNSDTKVVSTSSGLPPTPILEREEASKPKASSKATGDKLSDRGLPSSFDKPVKIEVPVIVKPKVETPTQKKSSSSRKKSASSKPSSPSTSSSSSKPKSSSRNVEKLIEFTPSRSFEQGHSYKIEISSPKEVLYGVQVAAVKDIEGMMKLLTKYQSMWFTDIYVNVETAMDGKPFYKIVLGAYLTRKEAEHYKKSLKTKKKIDGFVVLLR